MGNLSTSQRTFLVKCYKVMPNSLSIKVHRRPYNIRRVIKRVLEDNYYDEANPFEMAKINYIREWYEINKAVL